jgi:hypothetical protein
MALFDTGTGLSNLFEGMNIFGARQPEYLGGLLTKDQQEKLKNQSLLSGILGAGANYLAQPKNQNIGLPAILGKSYLGGMQQAQGTYDTATKNLLERLNIEKTARGIELQGMTEIDKLIAQRDKIAAENPNDPKLKIYDDALKTKSTRGEGINLNLGSPVAGIDAQGNPVFFQPSKTGGAPSIVSGVKPIQEPKAATESQAKAATFYSQMTNASKELNDLQKEGFKANDPYAQFGVSVAGTPLRAFTNPQNQRARQIQEQWAESFLRIKTGAAATKDEVSRNVATFFPQIGETDPSIIEQKARARQQAEQDVLAMTKPQTQQAQPKENQPTSKAKTVVRTGKDKSGKTVIQYSDGSIGYGD